MIFHSTFFRLGTMTSIRSGPLSYSRMRAVVLLLLVLAAGSVSAKAPVKYQASLQGAMFGRCLEQMHLPFRADDDKTT